MDADELIIDYGQDLELEQPGQTDGKPRIKGSSSNPVLSVQVDSIMLDVTSSWIMYHGMWLH
jgi:hypothetical protein